MTGQHGGVIDDERARFLHQPISAMLGTTDALAVPDATRVTGLVAVDDRHLRILIAAAATTARANASIGARVAVSATVIDTYESLQWKGRVVEAGTEPTREDLALRERHVAAFLERSPRVGIRVDVATALFPVDVVPLVVAVDALYDQTPGVGAGRLLEGGK